MNLYQKAKEYASGGYHSFRGGDSIARFQDADPAIEEAYLAGYRAAVADAHASLSALHGGHSYSTWIRALVLGVVHSLASIERE